MIDFVIVVIVIALVGLAMAYILKSKKKGKCVGCPYAKSCGSCSHTGKSVSSGSCGGACTGSSCHTNEK